MPVRPMLIGVAAIGVTLTAGFSAGARARVPAALSQMTGSVRFHHAHYMVDDPAGSMNEAARKVEGVRVILQGLGVGVRAGREFLLFDRAGDPVLPEQERSAATAYPLAVERLTAWGIGADPAAPSHVRVLTVLPNLPVHHLAFVANDFERAVQRIANAGAIALWRRDDSAMFDAGDGLAIEIVRDADRPETFWCPMHPDVRSADRGKCPVCGMGLVAIPPPRIGEYKLDVSQVRGIDGEVSGLRIAVREPDTYALVTKFAVAHEKILHLFVISRDLSYFAHVHPEALGDGTFALTHPFPGGEYMLIADFLPEGGTSQMVQKAIIVTARRRAVSSGDETGGLNVELQAGPLTAGKQARLIFTVRDAKTSAPVTDLQPYLGAPAHMLLVRRDLADAIHAHPEEQVSSGPSVAFHPIMPAPGVYRLWIQFQWRGQVSTTAFELSVDR